MRKLEIEIILTLEIKISQTQIEKEKKYVKNYCYKIKIFLNHLTNRVEELVNVCLFT